MQLCLAFEQLANWLIGEGCGSAWLLGSWPTGLKEKAAALPGFRTAGQLAEKRRLQLYLASLEQLANWLKGDGCSPAWLILEQLANWLKGEGCSST